MLAKEKEKGIKADKEKILILSGADKSFQEFGNAQKLVAFYLKNLVSGERTAQVLKEQIKVLPNGSVKFDIPK